MHRISAGEKSKQGANYKRKRQILGIRPQGVPSTENLQTYVHQYPDVRCGFEYGLLMGGHGIISSRTVPEDKARNWD